MQPGLMCGILLFFNLPSAKMLVFSLKLIKLDDKGTTRMKVTTMPGAARTAGFSLDHAHWVTRPEISSETDTETFFPIPNVFEFDTKTSS